MVAHLFVVLKRKADCVGSSNEVMKNSLFFGKKLGTDIVEKWASFVCDYWDFLSEDYCEFLSEALTAML